ncbi:WavE lipopolysaccharide synthesis family protein [Flavobacterium sp.]|jgi:hypothetical protein|uniref:WavE lipopolysaccharide synthesis family protein n=1 Tax=Flavobacterium sp. TaxID=239 RepID=UPI0037C11704
MKINLSDFSVVIQGPILGKPGEPFEMQLTSHCIESVRNVLPGSEIIISTWVGSEVSHLDYDKVVFSEDPGAITYNDFELKDVFNNNNRQIVSTINGLNIATKKYSIKLRPDFVFENSNFIGFIGKYEMSYRYKFFKNKIIVLTLSSRDPSKTPLLFAISDLFQVGLTEDLKKLWSIPLQPEPYTTRAFTYEKQFLNDPFKNNQYKMKYSSEQYIWYSFAKLNNLDISLKYFCEIPINKIRNSIISIIDNFAIYNPEQLGIIPPKRLQHSLNYMISNTRWFEMYNKICLNKSKYYLIKEIIKVYLNSIYFMKINIKNDLKVNFHFYKNNLYKKLFPYFKSDIT